MSTVVKKPDSGWQFKCNQTETRQELAGREVGGVGLYILGWHSIVCEHLASHWIHWLSADNTKHFQMEQRQQNWRLKLVLQTGKKEVKELNEVKYNIKQ